MDLRKLKKLIDLVEESGIAELEVTEGEEKVRIVKHASAITARAPRTAPPASQQPSVGHCSSGDEDELPDGDIIKAPMVGTFYRSTSPEAPPLVGIGSTVKEGDTLGVIESMKQINEIESDCDGVVRSILVENGQAVEFGTALFIID
jgi:acetyl-CoA carboxylase biotin carboxyl carrier protein